MRNTLIVVLVLMCVALAGCQTCPKKCCVKCPAAATCATGTAPAGKAVMVAKYTATPVKVDGSLDDEVWKTAPVYALEVPGGEGTKLQEPGEVRLAWDDKFLYVGVRYTDSDVLAEGKEDQMSHYLLGDLAEVFLKPAANTWYWELYVTPRGKKTSFWFPGRGRIGLPSSESYKMELAVGGQCQGTIDDWRDRDTSWTGEMAIPVTELTRHGDAFGPGKAWTILVARYNYSRYVTTRGAELSAAPKLSAVDYHLYEEYAELRLER